MKRSQVLQFRSFCNVGDYLCSFPLPHGEPVEPRTERFLQLINEKNRAPSTHLSLDNIRPRNLDTKPLKTDIMAFA
ncbi:hypothetical protein SAMN05443582_103508 [Phyllobacterium sp. OV277]|jgi:hypothetical protein|nr:hypothetical protein SAMN05443582_103508 [Phyllobacterium sp. OV277]